jgi:hypothetical protein
MSKFEVGDIIINSFVTPSITREIKHIYGGDLISSEMRTINFYVFTDGEYAGVGEVDNLYVLSLKGKLKKL